MTLALALLALTTPAFSLTFNASPTLERLSGESDRSGAYVYGSREGAKNASSSGFTGERERGQNVGEGGVVVNEGGEAPRPPQTVPPTKGDAPPVYIFTGQSPIKGVTIYTPKPDPTGNGSNSSEKTKEPISKWLVYGALGVGAAATIGGFFFPPLLFLGGLLLGAGAVLGYIRHKLNNPS